jgi:hypothetical protein
MSAAMDKVKVHMQLSFAALTAGDLKASDEHWKAAVSLLVADMKSGDKSCASGLSGASST